MTTREAARRRLRSGELTALEGTSIHRDADGFFFFLGPAAPQNERRGRVAVVHIRGPLDQFSDGGGDSYESIRQRVGWAFDGVKDADGDADGDADAHASPPSAVILSISSPGGVVAGLNETVEWMRRLRQQKGIRLVAYPNELAASAAYALCCACDEIVCPDSAIVGSIGTISTMISVAAQDAAMGVDVRLITSGARKADGHLHAPITDAAEAAEKARVDKLARRFFQIASRARGLSVQRIEAFEAGIYLGPDALKRGLVDDVRSLDDLVALLDEGAPSGAEAKGNDTDRRATAHNVIDGGTSSALLLGKETEAAMVRLEALIKKTEAQLTTAKDAKTRSRLEQELAALKFANTRAESDDPDKGDDDEDDEDDEKKSAKHAKKAEELKSKAEAMKHRARAEEYRKKAEEAEEAAKKCEGGEDDDEEEEARSKAMAALAALPSGGTDAEQALALVRSVGGIGAAKALFGNATALQSRVVRLEKARDVEERVALLASVKSCTTADERKFLADLSTRELRSFVDIRLKSGLVHTNEDTLVKPKVHEAGALAALPEEIQAEIEEAVAAAPSSDRKALREALVAAHTKQVTAALNGAPGGRY